MVRVKRPKSNNVPAKLRLGTEIIFAALIEMAPQNRLDTARRLVCQSICEHGCIVGRLEMDVNAAIESLVASTGNSQAIKRQTCSRRNLRKRNCRSTCERGNTKYYVTYSRIPKSAIKQDTGKERIRKLRSQWEETTKGAITT
jgi:hypothetical protein